LGGGEVPEPKIFFFFFSFSFVWNISHYNTNWARYDKKCYIDLHVNWPLFLSDFNENWIFSTAFRKILKYQISCKSVRWKPSYSMRIDGQTDRHDEANSFLFLANLITLLKKGIHISVCMYLSIKTWGLNLDYSCMTSFIYIPEMLSRWCLSHTAETRSFLDYCNKVLCTNCCRAAIAQSV
jgi:hypothetical protein